MSTPPTTPMTVAEEVPTLLAQEPIKQASSEPNLATMLAKNKLSRMKTRQTTKRKIGEVTPDNLTEMFEMMDRKSEERFNALITTLQEGIDTNSSQNKEIQMSVDFLAQKYEDAMVRIGQLEQERTSDKKYIKQLEMRLESMDRSIHSSCIEIRNIPKNTKESKEDMIKIVTQLGAAINAPIQPTQVCDVYRINTRNDDYKPLVVKLQSVILRDQIIDASKSYNKRNPTNRLNTHHIKQDGPRQQIYIADYLTFQAKKLFFQAREFAKANNFKFCWTTRGKIYLRRTEGSPLIKVNDATDLDNITLKQ